MLIIVSRAVYVHRGVRTAARANLRSLLLLLLLFLSLSFSLSAVWGNGVCHHYGVRLPWTHAHIHFFELLPCILLRLIYTKHYVRASLRVYERFARKKKLWHGDRTPDVSPRRGRSASHESKAQSLLPPFNVAPSVSCYKQLASTKPL